MQCPHTVAGPREYKVTKTEMRFLVQQLISHDAVALSPKQHFCFLESSKQKARLLTNVAFNRTAAARCTTEQLPTKPTLSSEKAEKAKLEAVRSLRVSFYIKKVDTSVGMGTTITGNKLNKHRQQLQGEECMNRCIPM